MRWWCCWISSSFFIQIALFFCEFGSSRIGWICLSTNFVHAILIGHLFRFVSLFVNRHLVRPAALLDGRVYSSQLLRLRRFSIYCYLSVCAHLRTACAHHLDAGTWVLSALLWYFKSFECKVFDDDQFYLWRWPHCQSHENPILCSCGQLFLWERINMSAHAKIIFFFCNIFHRIRCTSCRVHASHRVRLCQKCRWRQNIIAKKPICLLSCN